MWRTTFTFTFYNSVRPHSIECYACFVEVNENRQCYTTEDAEMSNKHDLHEKHFIAFGRGTPAVVNCGVLQKSGQFVFFLFFF